MASIFQRRKTWWIRFYHPRTKTLVRESLCTHDQARAELLRKKLEHLIALQRPEYGELPVPECLRAALQSDVSASADREPDHLSAAPVANAPKYGAAWSTPQLQPLEVKEAVRFYLEFCRMESPANRQTENKISVFRALLGSEAMQEVAPYRRNPKEAVPPFFRGQQVSELTSEHLLDFLRGAKVGNKTRRHYREILHHFFDVLLRLGKIAPQNFYCPNPVAALPAFVAFNTSPEIIYLAPKEVTEQIEILREDPPVRVAVALMIMAGLRRKEAINVVRSNLAEDLSHLRVANQPDPEADIPGRLKTGERTVSICPELREILIGHLATSDSILLSPNRQGTLWNGDVFRQTLRECNARSGLSWTCLHYRHTFATRRAAAGWPLLRLAREMGNSVRIIEQYYAGFIPPKTWEGESS